MTKKTNGDIVIEREIPENQAVKIVKMVAPKRRDYKIITTSKEAKPIPTPALQD